MSVETLLADLVTVEKTGPDAYVSKMKPVHMGNTMAIAYGGCAQSFALAAAMDTVPPGFTPYSVLGHFLGPASTNHKLQGTVHHLRTTRTFATRRVEVSQVQPDGKTRVCVALTADFQVAEASVADYSSPSFAAWPHWENCPAPDEMAASLVRRGVINASEVEASAAILGSKGHLVERRQCPNGVAAQNLIGVAKHVVTTQDDLPLTSKATADWIRAPTPPGPPRAHFAAAIFLMDASLSFMPLTHDHKFFDDAGACSTLDFAFRIFVPEIDLSEWCLQERSTIHGGWGRTYSEGRLRDDKGRLLASMTQQCILRPPPGGKAKM